MNSEAPRLSIDTEEKLRVAKIRTMECARDIVYALENMCKITCADKNYLSDEIVGGLTEAIVAYAIAVAKNGYAGHTLCAIAERILNAGTRELVVSDPQMGDGVKAFILSKKG